MRDVEQRVMERLLMEQMDYLPLCERAVVQMYYWQGMTQMEIAGVMGISQPMVNKRLENAILRLQLVIKNGFHSIYK